jgi:hypothetical protein
MAVEDLGACMKQWPDEIKAMITERVPVKSFDEALHQHSDEEIKVVVEW